MTASSEQFSRGAGAYAAYRPAYPAALCDFLAAAVSRAGRAWDCACGSGQAARGLVARFDRVVATDASRRQVAHAVSHPRIDYCVAAAERAPLAPASVDLVAVAQALHWLDPVQFYREIRRVLRPGGVIAAWTYALPVIDPAVDAVVRRLHGEVLAECWPPPRRHVDSAYRDLPFPFERLDAPQPAMIARWSLDRLLGYLGTWSAVQRYRATHGRDPIAVVADGLAAAWGEPGAPKTVRWPLRVLAGRVD
ncbi:MAG: class I SAM-dependent methyltransferase [Gammaproteobacteria bacterium]|nr:class I SAM-dependent methyltransferase [Gammaproteobacteria bacterium]